MQNIYYANLFMHECLLVKNVKNPPQRALMIHTYYTGKPGDNDNFINWTLEGFARQSAQFDVVKLSSHYSNGGQGLWDQFNAIVEEHETLVDQTADETPKENDYVQVYPVRTFLSRLLCSNADCVVVIKPKFSDEFAGELPRSVRTSMSVFSRQLEFDKKRKVQFSLNYSGKDGEKAKDWFLQQGAREMQDLLGFRNWAVTIGYQ